MNKIKISVIVVLAIMILSSLMLVNNTNVNNTNVATTKSTSTFTPASTVNSDYWNTTRNLYSNTQEILKQNTTNNWHNISINTGEEGSSGAFQSFSYTTTFTQTIYYSTTNKLYFMMIYDVYNSVIGDEVYYDIHITINSKTYTLTSDQTASGYANIQTFAINVPVSNFITQTGTYSITISGDANITIYNVGEANFYTYTPTTTFPFATAFYGNNNAILVANNTNITEWSGYENDYTSTFTPSIPSGDQAWSIIFSATNTVNLFVNSNEVLSTNSGSYYILATSGNFYFGAPYTSASEITITYSITQQLAFGNYVLPQFNPYPNLQYNGGNVSLYWSNGTNDYVIYNSFMSDATTVGNGGLNSLDTNSFPTNLSSFYVNFSFITQLSVARILIFIADDYTSSNFSVLFNTYNNTQIFSANSNVGVNGVFYNYIDIAIGTMILKLVPYTLTYKTYPVYFNETQLPSGSTYLLNVNGKDYSVSTSSFELNLTTDNYHYTASFGSLVSVGSFVVSGDYSTYSNNLTFISKNIYYLTTIVNGYSNGFYIYISGNTYHIFNHSTVQLLNGSYTIITNVYGYSIEYPNSIDMTSNKTIYFNFTMIARYLTFKAQGLPLGSNYTINFNNTVYKVMTQITFFEYKGNYNYTIANIVNYNINPQSATVNLQSNTTILITFTNLMHTLTVNVAGYTQGFAYTFSINLHTYILSGNSNTINIPNGTYNYVFNFNENFTWLNGAITITGNTILNETVNVKIYHLTFISNFVPYFLTINNGSNYVLNTFYYNTTNHNTQYSASALNYIVHYSQSELTYAINQTIYINFTKLYEYILVSEINTDWNVVFNNITYTANTGNIILFSNNSQITFGVDAINGYIPQHYLNTINASSYTTIYIVNFTTANNIQSEQNSMFSLLPYFLIVLTVAIPAIAVYVRRKRYE